MRGMPCRAVPCHICSRRTGAGLRFLRLGSLLSEISTVYFLPRPRFGYVLLCRNNDDPEDVEVRHHYINGVNLTSGGFVDLCHCYRVRHFTLRTLEFSSPAVPFD